MSPRLWASSELKQFQVNLIYLASLSGRVPIIPPFIPGPSPHLCEFFFRKYFFISNLKVPP